MVLSIYKEKVASQKLLLKYDKSTMLCSTSILCTIEEKCYQILFWSKTLKNEAL